MKLEKFLTAAKQDLRSITDPQFYSKDDFHSEGLKVAKALGKALGLTHKKPTKGKEIEPGTFYASSNKGGYSVMGEIMLTTATFEIWFCGDVGRILFRTRQGCQTGPNIWADWDSLNEFQLINQMRLAGIN